MDAQALLQRQGQVLIQRGRTAEHSAHTRQVVVIHHRVLCQLHGDRRGDQREVHLELLVVLQEALQLEARHHNQLGTLRQRQVHKRGQAIDVEERQDRVHRVVPAQQVDVLALLHVGHQLAVHQTHALRQAGGAGGVGEYRQVLVRVDLYLGGSAALCHDLLHALGGIQVDDVFFCDAGILSPLGRGVTKRGNSKQHLRARVLNLCGHGLRRGKQRQRRYDSADAPQAVGGDDEVQGVGQVQRHHVALFDALADQPACGGLDVVLQLREGRFGAIGDVDDGDAVFFFRGEVAEDVVVET